LQGLIHMADDSFSLSGDFDDATEAQWLTAVGKALKGRGIEAITRETLDGIKIHPLYRETNFHAASNPLGMPGAAPFLRGPESTPNSDRPWDIRQAFTHASPEQTHHEIMRDLERGISSIELKHDCTGQNGVQLCDLSAFKTVLQGVLPDIATIALDHGGGSGTSTASLLALWTEQNSNPQSAHLAFNIDPLGALARSGLLESGLDASFAKLAAFFDKTEAKFPNATYLRSDARAVHEAGGSEAQELAALIASALDTLRRLNVHGISPTRAAPHIVFTLALDANYGIGISKLRAARRLWARCLDALNIPAQPMILQAYSSARMLTRYDAWTNMLRGTAACFAGAVGEADVITIRAFNEALGTPEELGRRIARNTQIMAMEESQLGRVADPTGGAWFTETLANDLAEAAWAEFQQIESEGGYGASLMADAFQARVADTRATRMQQIAKRKIPITGISEFPLLDGVEAPIAEATKVTAQDGVSPEGLAHYGVDGIPADKQPSEAEPFWPIRLSAAYERLRDLAESRAERPSIFIATLGPVAEHTGRADFARNLFAAGGISSTEALVPPESHTELAAAFKASGCQLAVICGSDTRYKDEAESAAKHLKDAGALRLYLAGKPGDLKTVWIAAGIESFIHVGVDVIHTLELAHAELGLLS
jgi:methylmalonyl-CoA mutase